MASLSAVARLFGLSWESVEGIEPRVLEQVPYFFRNTYQRAPAPARAALEALARGESPKIDRQARRWLRRRRLLTDEDQLSIPIVGTWLREEVL